MKNLKLAVLSLAILFLITSSFLNLPLLFNKILYSIMAICSILFLFLKRDDLQMNKMFSKKEDKDTFEN